MKACKEVRVRNFVAKNNFNKCSRHKDKSKYNRLNKHKKRGANYE